MRRRAPAVAILALLLCGCAHVEAPPGGEEDTLPPRLLEVRPDSFAVVPDFRDRVAFSFDERVSEQGLEEAVTVSPRTSPVRVDHSGSTVRVSLREGWVPGTVYHVEIGGAVRDLFNNPLGSPVGLVFSTGPEIPDTRLAGEVVDRVTLSPATDLRVEAVRRADSLVYATRSDSAGRFSLPHIPAGEYLLRAFEDVNRNRTLDPFETRDTAAALVTEGDSARVELAVVMPDSTPPVITEIRVAEERIEIEFDDYLDPNQPLSAEAVELRAPDGGTVSVRQIAVGALSAPDTAATAADTVETEAARPSQTLSLGLAQGALLRPETDYELRVPPVRNIVGLAAPVDTVVQAEAVPEPEDAAEPDGVEADGGESDLRDLGEPAPRDTLDAGAAQTARAEPGADGTDDRGTADRGAVSRTRTAGVGRIAAGSIHRPANPERNV